MTRPTAILALLVLVAVGVAALSVPPVAAQDVTQTENKTAGSGAETAGTDTDAVGTETATADDGTGDMGAQMTAFMQSSAAAADDTVESGMWTAAFDRANESQQARLAVNRTKGIERKIERLRERNHTLTARYENGSLSEPAYVAQTSQLAGRLDALRSSINETERAAQRAGVDAPGIERVRAGARNVTAPSAPGVGRAIAHGRQRAGPNGSERKGSSPQAVGQPDHAGSSGGPSTNTTGGHGPEHGDGPAKAGPHTGNASTGSAPAPRSATTQRHGASAGQQRGHSTEGDAHGDHGQASGAGPSENRVGNTNDAKRGRPATNASARGAEAAGQPAGNGADEDGGSPAS